MKNILPMTLCAAGAVTLVTVILLSSSPSANVALTTFELRDMLGIESSEGFPDPGCRSQHFRSCVYDDPAIGGLSLEVEFAEKDPLTSDWHEIHRFLSFSYGLTAITIAPNGRDLFVAGVTDDNTKVIERIAFPARLAGVSVQTAIPPNPAVGVPLGKYLAAEVLPVDGFVEPGSRSYTNEERSTILRGPSLDLIRCLATDPEGRYLVFVTVQGDVYYVNRTVSPAPSPVMLYSAAEFPELKDVMRTDLREFADGGRALFMTASHSGALSSGVVSSGPMILMRDGNNDAVFDDLIVLTKAEYRAAGFRTYAAWSNMRSVDFEQAW